MDTRPVLAAVEAMEQLAADAHRRHPDVDHRRLTRIRFPKFLYLDDRTPVDASNHTEPLSDGALRSTLTTRFSSPGASITRILEHAALTIGGPASTDAPPPLDTVACLAGLCTEVDPQRIYNEMVPFGPAYRNIRRPLLLSPDGALARVGSPTDRRTDLCLGSPYVLDAAFHAACVWCQRYGGSVAFPVAVRWRCVMRPTRMNAAYTARVLPVQTDREPFEFDIVIVDDDGGLREIVTGVQMRDVSGGRKKPPDGFMQPPVDPLAAWRPHLADLVLVDRGALAPCAAAALSPDENRRLQDMTAKRKQSYLSARLALKRLSRMICGRQPDGSDGRPAQEIETIAADQRAPCCPTTAGTPVHCSVSHDRRFTVAVAANRPVGVDVERLSSTLLETMHLYMHADEQVMVERCKMDRIHGALRVWSAKEAAAKALGIDLVRAWERTRVSSVSADTSRLLDRESDRTWPVGHAALDDHLFTLLVMDGAS